MADLHDVENAILAAITQVVYPTGTANASIANANVIVGRGWPIPGDLDKDLSSGNITITVFPLDNEQKVTRFPKEWYITLQPANNLTIAVSGNAATLGGTPSSPLNAALIVNGRGYIYPVQPGDTLTTIATGLAALVNADTAASSNGATITVPGANRLAGLTGGVGQMQRETKRQKRGFMITFWCPDPGTRDAMAPPVDAALADIDFLSLPDGTAARLIYERTRVSDRVENEGLYRRDLMYSVEYPTTDTQGVAQILVAMLQMTDSNGIPIGSPGALLLAEDGQALLDETGRRIAAEEDNIAAEDGSNTLAEDGERINVD